LGDAIHDTLPRWLNHGDASMTEPMPWRTADGALSGRLDYNWWASNGPTGGYLVRLALEAVGRLPGFAGVTPRSVDLHVVRLAAADDFDMTVAFSQAAGGVATVAMTFGQGEPFATASVQVGRRLAAQSIEPSHRLGAWPPEVYPEMATPGTRLPPVTGRFHYRPATNPDGTSPQPGWDLVWVSRRAGQCSGQAETATILDCWYPATHMRVVREHLRGSRALMSQPQPTNLIGAHVVFTAPDAAYENLGSVLLGSRLTSVVDGYHFEQQEIWSERGDLLVGAQLVRRQECVQLDHCGAPR
jgi:hypothetical protein